jgi:hypothetical protein
MSMFVFNFYFDVSQNVISDEMIVFSGMDDVADTLIW